MNDPSTQILAHAHAHALEQKTNEVGIVSEKRTELTVLKNSITLGRCDGRMAPDEGISQQEGIAAFQKEKEQTDGEDLTAFGLESDQISVREFSAPSKEKSSTNGLKLLQNNQGTTSVLEKQIEHNDQNESIVSEFEFEIKSTSKNSSTIDIEKNIRNDSTTLAMEEEQRKIRKSMAGVIESEQNTCEVSNAIGKEGKPNDQEELNILEEECENSGRKASGNINAGQEETGLSDPNASCTARIVDSMNIDLTECMPVILNVRGNANEEDAVITDEFDSSTLGEKSKMHEIGASSLYCGSKDLLQKIANRICLESSQVEANSVTPSLTPLSLFTSCPISMASLSTATSLTAAVESSNGNPTIKLGKPISSSAREIDQALPHGLSSECSQSLLSSRNKCIQANASNSSSEGQMSVSQLKLPFNVQRLPQTRIKIIANGQGGQPKYVVTMLNPSQTTSDAKKVNVPTAAVNSFSVSKGLSVKMNNTGQPTHETPTALVSSQSPRVISAVRVRNDQQPKLLTSVLLSSENLNSKKNPLQKNTNQDQTTSISLINYPFTGMNRSEILESGLLRRSKKPRRDITKEYVCNVCGEEFHNEEFLHFHLERNVFVLRYFCQQCSYTFTFNNKCAFWNHIEKEITNNENRLEKEKSFIRLDPYLPSAAEESSHSASPTSTSESLLLEAAESHKIQHTPPTAKECPYCFCKFSTPSCLKSHFEKVSKSLVFDCHLCEMILFNCCSMAAHRQIHSMAITQRQAHCPECGVTLPYSQDLRGVFEHLDSCYHFNTTYVIVCACGAERQSIKAMKEHMLESHTKVTLHHRSSSHLFESINELSPENRVWNAEASAFVTVTCCLRSKVFCHPATLQKHVEAQVASFFKDQKQKRYKCTLCSKLFISPHQLGKHMENDHTHKPKRCTLCFGLFKSRQNLVSHLVTKSCTKKFPKVLHLCVDSTQEIEIDFDNSQYVNLFNMKGPGNRPLSIATQMNPNQKIIVASKGQPIAKQINLVTNVSASNEKVSASPNDPNVVTLQRQPVSQQSKPVYKTSLPVLHLSQSVHSQKQTSQPRPQLSQNVSLQSQLSQSRPRLSQSVHLQKQQSQFTPQLSQSLHPRKQLSQSVTQVSQNMQTRKQPGQSTSQLSQCVQPQKQPSHSASQFSQSVQLQKPPISQSSQCSPKDRQSHLQISPLVSSQKRFFRIAFDKRLPASKNKIIEARKYQCHMCKIILIGSKNYEMHMTYHQSSSLKTGRTHCVVCKKAIANSSIHSHLEEHQNQGVIVCTLCHRRDFANIGQARDHSRNWCYYKVESGWGQTALRQLNKQSPLSDAGTNNFFGHVGHGKGQCKTEDNGNESPPESRSNENEPLLFPCLMCGLTFTTKQAKDDHVSRVHDGTQTFFSCGLCKKRGICKAFSKRQKTSLHISRKHRIADLATISKLIIEEERNMTSGQVIILDTSSQENPGAPPPKRLRLEAVGTFLCGKCGFSDGQRDSFEQHIKSHNPKDEPQCPECGLCFTVYAALKKHIFAVHKIKKVDAYLKERGIEENMEEVESEDESMNSAPYIELDVAEDFDQSKPSQSGRRKSSGKSDNLLECTVCYRKFSSEAVLKSHMRNHGMAFIRSRRHVSKSQALPLSSYQTI